MASRAEQKVAKQILKGNAEAVIKLMQSADAEVSSAAFRSLLWPFWVKGKHRQCVVQTPTIDEHSTSQTTEVALTPCVDYVKAHPQAIRECVAIAAGADRTSNLASHGEMVGARAVLLVLHGEAVNPLIALLTDDPDPVVSAEAATLLGAIGNDVAVLRALSGALEDRRLVHMRPVVADAAAKALERRGWR